jgi:hypothetical protein
MFKTKEQKTAYNKKYNADNKTYFQDKHRQRKYNVNSEEFKAIFIAQGSCCAICKTQETSKTGWHLDHDHITGKLRGILCQHCNNGLGYFKDNIHHLAIAISYLMRYL